MKAASYLVNNVMSFFEKLGDMNYTFGQKELDAVFSKDFVMIAHGKKTCGYDTLSAHFDHIRQQTGNIRLVVHEMVITPEKQVVRYDLVTQRKGTGHVIAIFKFRPGETTTYEMNEVFNTGSNTLDVSV